MSIFDEIEDVKAQVLSSDLPETINATVLAAERSVKKGAYAGAPLLKLELLTDDNITFSNSYRIPKALTGKGQLDKFLDQCKKLKVAPKDVVGKRFEWKRLELEGGVTGNARFYPIKLLAKK